MRAAWAIYKRELIANFYSPLAYAVMVSFLVFNGVVFWFFMKITASNPAVVGARGPLQMFFGSTMLSVLSLMIFCPALTMRTFAEERRSRTMETLLTAPVTDEAVVAGKFLGAFTTYAALRLPTPTPSWCGATARSTGPPSGRPTRACCSSAARSPPSGC